MTAQAPPSAPSPRSPITLRERVLLHLAGQSPSRDRYAVPKEVTQTGIAAALGVRTGHISREMGKLVADGLVEERESAVEGGKRHQKAYFLSPPGLQAVTRLRGELPPEALPSARAPSGAPAGAPPPLAQGPVRLGREVPQPRYFFGRTEELAAALSALHDRAVLVIIGIAGIGKSTFGSRLFEEVARERSAVWHGVREYDNATSLLEPTASLLAAVGRPRLQLLLKREGQVDLARVREVVVQDVEGLRLAAFVDDVQAAGPEALMAVRVLREAACAAGGALKLVLLSRVRPPVYDAREVALHRLVAEFDLAGLDRAAVTALLEVGKRDASAESVFDMTAGHPLFVELVRDSERGAAAGGRADPRHIDRFLHDEIFSKLSPGELALLPRVVFVRRPVDPRVVLAAPATLQNLIDLENRSLLRRDARGRVSMHDAVRDFVRRTLPQEEGRRQSASVLAALQEEARRALSENDAEYRVDLLESALDLCTDEAARGAVLSGLARAHFDLMQYGAAILRGKEALELARQGGERPAVLEALVALADIHVEAAHAEASLEYLREADALAALEPLPPAALQGRLFLARAKWQDAFGSPAQANEWAQRALPLARATQDLDLEARVELVFSHTTPAPEAHEHMARCIELAGRAGDLALVSFAHAVAAWHRVHFSGDLERALAHAREGLKVGEAIQNRALANWSLVSVAKVQWRAGDFEASLETARTAMEGGDRLVSYQLYPLYLISLAETDGGDAVAGERIARDLVRLAEEFDWSWAGTAPLRALAEALEAQGREEEALPLLETAHAFAVKTDRPCDMGGDAVVVERLIEIDARRGNGPAVERWTKSLDHICSFLDGPVVEAFGAMAAGHLASKSDPRAAAAAYGAAAVRWKQAGWKAFELRMVRAALDHGKRAQGEGGKWPAGLADEAALERREAELEAALAPR